MNAQSSSRAHERGCAASRRISWSRTLVAKGSAALRREHLRFVPVVPAAKALHCLLVDCSGSMLAAQQLALAKGLLLQLIGMAHKQRAEIAIVSYAGKSAKVLVRTTSARPMTSAHADRWLQPVRGGGGTPFSKGVVAATNLLAQGKPGQQRWLWLLTDGRTMESPLRPSVADVAVVVDCERNRIRLNGCLALAKRWGADYRLLSDFELDVGGRSK